MSFEADSLLPIPIPIPTLAGRLHSIVFPRDNTKVHAGQDDGGISALSTRVVEERRGEYAKRSSADGVM